MGGLCCAEVNESPAPSQAPAHGHHNPVHVPHGDTSSIDTFTPPPTPLPFDSPLAITRTSRAAREICGDNTAGSSSTQENVNESERISGSEIEHENLSRRVIIEEEEEEDLCAICLEEYDAENNPKHSTVCNHNFHRACIEKWMQKKRICPVCDQEL